MDPHPNVLSRDDTEKARGLELLGGLLDEAVNFGTHLFSWCLEAQPVKHPDLVISTLLHQLVETLDGAAVLIRQSCAEPTKSVLRSALESSLGLLYMLETDTDKRALCYHVSDGHRRLDMLKRFDLANPEGLKYREVLRADTSGFKMGEEAFRDTSKEVAELQRKLEGDDEIREASAAWERAKRKNRGNPPYWYSLFDGPTSVKKLSEHLHFTAWYAVLYGEWSATSHGANAMARLHIGPGVVGRTGEARVRGLRDASELQLLTSVGASMAVLIFTRIVETRVPKRMPDFLSWYAGIRDRYTRISDPEPLFKFREQPP